MLTAIINFFKPKCQHEFRSISQYTGRYTKYGVNKAISSESNSYKNNKPEFGQMARVFEVSTVHACKKCDFTKTENQWVTTKGPKGSLYKKR